METESVETVNHLTPLQQGMLFHSLYAPHSGVYLQQLVCCLHHELNIAAFESAWQQVIARHDIFRTSYRWEGLDHPVQEVHRRIDLSLDVRDYASFSATEQAGQLDTFLAGDRRNGFCFTKPPLLRLTLFRFAADDYRLIWTSHHSLMDGRSRLQVLQEVFAIYEGRDQLDALPPVRPFSDYLKWLAERDLSAAESYWRRLLNGFDSTNDIVIDKKTVHAKEQESWGEESVRLSPAETSALLSLAQQHEITLNTLVEGCWALILNRYCDRDDVVFGAVRVCRWTDPGEAVSAGLFINTVPLRVILKPDMPVLELLKELRRQSLTLRDYAHTPLVKIQEWSALPLSQPLFDTIVVFENYQLDLALRSLGGNWRLREFKLLEQTNYPLAVSAYADYDQPSLLLKLTFDRGRFDETHIRDMAQRFQRLLESISVNPGQLIAELSWLTEAERHQILIQWNATERTYPREMSIHGLFEVQAERTPGKVALIAENEQITFDELNQRANQLAHYLKKNGVVPEERVAICMTRSVEFVVGLLGILKAGAAYVPIDDKCPEQRLSFILRNSDARILLTQDHLWESLSALDATVVDVNCAEIATESMHNLSLQVTGGNAAHVIYTSGSTGIPKGVLSSHRASLNRFFWMWEVYPFAADEICCQKTSPAFVDSIWEIFGPLLKGVPQLIVAEHVVKNPALLLETLAAHCVTRIVLVPSLLSAILETDQKLEQISNSLRYCFCSGETLPLKLATAFRARLPRTRLINLYGSTEVAADVTCHEITTTDGSDRVSIGRPISNSQIYILDSGLRPAPVGLIGEIYVGGDGLAREYLHRSDFTAERFIPDPFSVVSGARLFRTGDLGRYLSDGNIDYLGRCDLQVKVRGFRVEIGEVEAILSGHPNVRHSIVIARENSFGDKDLIAFIVPYEQPLSTAELRAFLREKLPDYMMPARFVLLERLPLTSSGKPDRRALSTSVASATTTPDVTVAYVAPRNSIETTLGAIWSEVLEVTRVGVHDDFLTLGGTSLKAMRVLSRVGKAFHVEFPLRTLFDSGTISVLAVQVEKAIIAKLEGLTDQEAQQLLEGFPAP